MRANCLYGLILFLFVCALTIMAGNSGYAGINSYYNVMKSDGAGFHCDQNRTYYTPNNDDIKKIFPMIGSHEYIKSVAFNTEMPANSFDLEGYSYITLYNNHEVRHKVNTFLWLDNEKNFIETAKTIDNPPDDSDSLLNGSNSFS